MMKMLFRAGLALLVVAATPALAQSDNIGKDARLPAGYAPGTVIYCDNGAGKVAMCSFGSGGSGGVAGTEYTEDAAASANPVASALQLRRRDAPSTAEVSADGDWITALADSQGQMRVRAKELEALLSGTLTVSQSGAWNVSVSNFPATQPISAAALPLPTNAATAAGVAAVAAALPAKDANGDLRVPTVTVTAYYVSIAANTSTEILAASATRIGYDIQCTGAAAVGLSRTHATLSGATPSSGGVDLVIPAGTTPFFQPAYVSGLGVTAYTTSAQSCWGNSYARQ